MISAAFGLDSATGAGLLVDTNLLLSGFACRYEP
jgi:hypothetical protein